MRTSGPFLHTVSRVVLLVVVGRRFHVVRVYVSTVHRHVHLARSKTHEQPPTYRVVSVDAIEYGWFRVESNVAANCHRQFIVGPKVARAPQRVRADAKDWMMLRDAEQGSIRRSQQIVFVD